MSSKDTPQPPRVPFRESDARAVLLVRAYEEADAEGVLLGTRERRRATEAARSATENRGDVERTSTFWVERANQLLEPLGERAAVDPRMLLRSPGELHPAWILVPAVLLGLATTRLGPDRQLNVLAFPLIGLILWNLLSYVALLLSRGRGEKLFGPVAGALDWATRSTLARARKHMGASATVDADAVTRFVRWWREVGGALGATRIRRWLHLAAFALVLTIVGGMYLDGIAREYRATWESTFLTEAQVERILGIVLWPATKVLGRPVPDLVRDGEAASWIHLYVVTAALFVLVPRALLFLYESGRAGRLAAAVPLDLSTAYYRRLTASGRGARMRAEIMPYSYRPGARATDGLKSLLHDVVGARAEVRVFERLEYGAEASEAEVFTAAGDEEGSRTCCVTLFGLAQSPEVEVHGRFLEELKERVPDGGSLLVVVDGSTYRENMSGAQGATDRLDERRRAWDRVVREAGLAAVHVELDRLPPDEVLAELIAAIWPPDAMAGVA